MAYAIQSTQPMPQQHLGIMSAASGGGASQFLPNMQLQLLPSGLASATAPSTVHSLMHTNNFAWAQSLPVLDANVATQHTPAHAALLQLVAQQQPQQPNIQLLQNDAGMQFIAQQRAPMQPVANSGTTASTGRPSAMLLSNPATVAASCAPPLLSYEDMLSHQTVQQLLLDRDRSEPGSTDASANSASDMSLFMLLDGGDENSPNATSLYIKNLPRGARRAGKANGNDWSTSEADSCCPATAIAYPLSPTPLTPHDTHIVSFKLALVRALVRSLLPG
jgi:hypothetical protein